MYKKILGTYVDSPKKVYSEFDAHSQAKGYEEVMKDECIEEGIA